jgi:LPS sulfotransferase NodH
MRTENFLVAGAQRSGTTCLYHLLDQHPGIEMARPLRPEPKFFLRPDADRLDRDAYRMLFSGNGQARVRGEKSTSYMERPDIAPRVLALLPDVRIVFLLRDPVERAISNYRFSLANGVETQPIEDAILGEDARRDHYDRARFSVSPFAYVARGHYHRFIDRWVAAVGRERIRPLVFEHLVADLRIVQELFGWLGVDRRFEPVLRPQTQNASPSSNDVPAGIRRHLARQFQASNLELRDRYGLDVAHWQSSEASCA